MRWSRAVDRDGIVSNCCEISDCGLFTICRVMMNGKAHYELWRRAKANLSNLFEREWVERTMLSTLGPHEMTDMEGRKHSIQILKDTAESLA